MGERLRRGGWRGEMARWVENGGEWEMVESGMVEGGRNGGGR